MDIHNKTINLPSVIVPVIIAVLLLLLYFVLQPIVYYIAAVMQRTQNNPDREGLQLEPKPRELA